MGPLHLNVLRALLAFKTVRLARLLPTHGFTFLLLQGGRPFWPVPDNSTFSCSLVILAFSALCSQWANFSG
jgi:hypothetical protein